MSSVPALTALMDTDGLRTHLGSEGGGVCGDPASSSLPVGEEGDDGEGGVVGVREDVLNEQVGLAAVLWAESQRIDRIRTRKYQQNQTPAELGTILVTCERFKTSDGRNHV